MRLFPKQGLAHYLIPAVGLSLLALGLAQLAFAGLGEAVAASYAPLLLGMGCNTALSFLLAGAALFRFHVKPDLKPFIAIGWSLALLATASLVLSRLEWAPSDGPWRLLVNTLPSESPGAWPGRMSPVTAACLLLAGLVMANSRRIEGVRASLTALGALGLLLGLALTAVSLHILNINLFNHAEPVRAYLSLPSGIALLLLWLGLTQVGMETWLRRFFQGHAERHILYFVGLLLFILLLMGSVLNNNMFARQIIDAYRHTMRLDLAARQLSLEQEITEAEHRALQLAELLGRLGPSELRALLDGSTRMSMVPDLAGLALQSGQGRRQILRGAWLEHPRFALDVAGGRTRLLWQNRWLIETRAVLPDVKGSLVMQMPTEHLLSAPADRRARGDEGEWLICASLAGPDRCVPLDPASASGDRPRPPQLPALVDKSETGGVVVNLAAYGRQEALAYAPVGNTSLYMVEISAISPLVVSLQARYLSSVVLLVGLIILGALALHRFMRPILRDMERARRDYHLLFDSVSDGILGVDMEGRIASFNQAAMHILGYAPHELKGMPVQGLMHTPRACGEQDDTQACRVYATLRDGQSREELGITYETRDGHNRIVDSQCNPIWEGGKIVGAVLTFRDITRSRNVERKLGRTEDILARAQQVARLGSWYQEDGFLDWSSEARRILDLEADQPFDLDDLFALAHPDDRDEVLSAWRRGHQDGSCDTMFRIVSRGTERWLRIRADLETDDAGRLVRSIGTLVDNTEQKDLELDLLRSRTKLRQLTAYREKAREDERAYIARELHDHLGQYLTALHMDANLVQVLFAKEDAELIARLDGMKQLIEHTINEVRGVIARLRPMALDLGLISAAEWLVADFQKRTGMECQLEVPTPELHLDAERETTIFRILQEALTNVARHARARRVNIRIESTAERFEMEIRDDGRGFDHSVVRTKKSFGLMGIRERVLIYGGSAKIDSKPGMGTTLRVTFPSAKGEAP